MFYKDDWVSWSCDGIKFGSKTTPQSKFELEFKKIINRPLKSHKEELLENTRVLRDKFSEPFDLLFSGGLDSEVILRCHHELKIPINVFTFKFENDYNIKDVTHALRIGDELNVKINVIDFNVKKFFENDAYSFWSKSYFASAGLLPHMKMLEYLDNIPVMGGGVPIWNFMSTEWKFQLRDWGICWPGGTKRSMIHNWYEYSPEVILSHTLLPQIQNVINSTTINNNCTYEQYKYFVYKNIWKNIEIRTKRNGYEGTNIVPRVTDTTLTCIKEFSQMYIEPLNISNIIDNITQEELFALIV
jgi:hypothetical protein